MDNILCTRKRIILSTELRWGSPNSQKGPQIENHNENGADPGSAKFCRSERSSRNDIVVYSISGQDVLPCRRSGSWAITLLYLKPAMSPQRGLYYFNSESWLTFVFGLARGLAARDSAIPRSPGLPFMIVSWILALLIISLDMKVAGEPYKGNYLHMAVRNIYLAIVANYINSDTGPNSVYSV